MKYWVGVTDNRWFNFLAGAAVDEVNFWQPGGRAPFSDLRPGSLFLFKLKRPYHHIAGGGYFVRSTALPLSLAWDSFGRKNGAASRGEFEAIVRGLSSRGADRDPEIGCTILTQPFFWPSDVWISEPDGFAANIVRGRYYDTATEIGSDLWAKVRERQGVDINVIAEPQTLLGSGTYGTPTLVRPRLGQGAFRVLVTDAYRRRCALTGESTLPVLEAAHILPFSESGPHEISNGLLLRADFHKLFDIGMITVTPEHKIEVSSQIREMWFNGKAYYRLHGQQLASLPDAAADRPNPEFLRWHNEHRFVP